jgi:hypothetical protein
MSTILVDNLTGKTSAGSITVTSEGGAATQSLQQGLAKAWANIDANAATPSSRDSLNTSGIVDNGIGDYTCLFVSSFSAADYAPSMLSYGGNGVASLLATSDIATGSLVLNYQYDNAGTWTQFDTDPAVYTIHGDLA